MGDTIYLLDYNRDLQEVFSSRSVMDQKGILLGIVPEDVPYETNKQDSILAFVQNRTLWMYNKKNEELTKVFSFAEEDTDHQYGRSWEYCLCGLWIYEPGRA